MSLIEHGLRVQDRAQHCDRAVRRLWKGMREDWYSLGSHAYEMWKDELWKHLADEDGKPYRSFDGWIKSAVPEAGRSTIYASRRVYEQLQGIPETELKQIPKANSMVLQHLPKKLRSDKNWVLNAQRLSERKFKELVKKELPEVDINERTSFKLYLTEGQRAIIEEAIAAACRKADTEDRNEGAELLCIDWLDSPCGIEEYGNRSNREVFGAKD